MDLRRGKADRVIGIYPYLLFLVVILGLGLTLYLGRLDLAVMSLVLVVPILLVGLFLLRQKGPAVLPVSLEIDGWLKFHHLVLINILLTVGSVVLLLISAERPLGYFMLMAVSGGILFWQVIEKRAVWTDYLIILEIMLLSLNLIWSLGLKYPLYFGGTDILVHLNYIETIEETGYLGGIGDTYRYFPAYHIYIAIGAKLTGLSLQSATFGIMGIAWQGATLLGYLIFRQLSGSSRLALVACLVFALSEIMLYYGSYSIARSLDYIFFLGWFYLVLSLVKKDSRYIPLLLVFMAAFILTHHVTVILLFPVLILLYILQKLFFGLFNEKELLSSRPLVLLGISFFSYLVWIASGLFNSTVRDFFYTLFQTETQLVLNERMLLGGATAFIFNSLYYSFVLIFTLIGVGAAWSAGKEGRQQKTLRTLALTALLFLVLFLPYPLGLLPQAQVSFAQRYPLLVLPFIAIIMAYGVGYLMEKESGPRRDRQHTGRLPVLTLGLITLATFFSLITGLNAQDNSKFPHTAEVPSTYFTQAELDSITFLNQEGDSALTLHSDYYTVRNTYYLTNLPSRKVLTGGDLSYIEQGYVIFREGELQQRGVLLFSPPGKTLETYWFKVDPSRPETDIVKSVLQEDNIYSNGRVKILIRL